MRPSPFLRTRVARRILLLFLFCAVLPLVLLAGLGYRRLADDLEDSTRAHLRQQSKASGMMLLDRLGSLAGLLATMATEIQADRPLRVASVASTTTASGPQFRALGVVRPDGQVDNIQGELPELPVLLPGQEAHLQDGGVALVTGPGPGGVRVFLVRAVDAIPRSRLWGFIDRRSVFGTDPSTSVAPVDALPCLTTERGETLSCLAPETLLLAPPSSGGTFRWYRGSDGYLAARWTLFLRQLYAAPSWTISLSMPESVVSAPLQSLRQVFLLGLGLAVAVVFTLAHIQLRRSMEPLEALEAGTARVAAGQFDEPVVVRSGDEFQALAGSFNRMASDLGRQFHHQNALARVHEVALAAAGPEAVLRALFAGQSALLPGESVTVALARPDEPERWTVTRSRGGEIDHAPLEVHPDRTELEELAQRVEGFILARGERTRSYLGVGNRELPDEALVLPLRSKGGLAGVIVVTGAPEQIRKPGLLAEARRTADEAALAISNAQLLAQLDEMNWGALKALARTIDAVSPWTAGHSERVTVGALEIGRRLGFSEEEIDLLHRGGLLHDIGKVGVPVRILDKPDDLTDEEFAQIKQHPMIGARILAPIGAFRRALPLVLHHHELLDGSGYPHGLEGDQIPLAVRVLTVADVFDALVSDRPYRTAWPVEKAITYLRENVGIKFDGAAVAALGAAVETGWRPVVSSPANRATDVAGPYALPTWKDIKEEAARGPASEASLSSARS
jgi:HAMP domain-containing protein